MKVFYKLILIFWVCLARPSKITQNLLVWLGVMQEKVAILNYGKIVNSPVKLLRNNRLTAFVFYCDAKHSKILRESSHVCCYLFLRKFY